MPDDSIESSSSFSSFDGPAPSLDTPVVAPDASPEGGEVASPQDPLDLIMEASEIAANAERDVDAEEHGFDVPRTGDRGDAGADELDAIMETAEISANAEAEVEAEEAAAEAADDEDEGDDLVDADGESAEQSAPPDEVLRLRAELASIRQADAQVLTELATLTGYTADPQYPNRTRIDVLREKVERNIATEAERQQLAEMRQWHDVAGPVYRAAAAQVGAQYNGTIAQYNTAWGHFIEDVGQVFQSFGVPQDVINRWKATADIAPIRAHAKRGGTSQPSTTGQRSSQRAAAPARRAQDGLAGMLAQAFDPKTGFPTDEFDALVKRGALLDVDLAKH